MMETDTPVTAPPASADTGNTATAIADDANGDAMDAVPAGPPGVDPTTLPGASALQQADSLLNEGIESEIEKFLSAGGTQRQAFDLMVGSYDGVPDAITQLVRWTPILRRTESILDNALEQVLKEHQQSVVSRVDQEMVLMDQAPEFLYELNSSTRWRPVVARLGNQNRGSALFNFLARTARLKDAGVDTAVMSAPAPFLNAISEEVSRLMARPRLSESDLVSFYRRIRSLSTFDESCTAIAIRLFASLAQRANDPFTRRLYRRAAQEIRAEAVRVMENVAGVPRATALQFVQRLAIVLECVAAGSPVKKEVLDALVALLSRERVASRRYDSEVMVLNQAFRGLLGEPTDDDIQLIDGGNADDSPSRVPTIGQLSQEEAAKREVLVGMLCHAEVFRALIHSLFTHAGRSYVGVQSRVDTNRRHCLCLLLSYAGVFLSLQGDEIVQRLQDSEALKTMREKSAALRNRLERVAIVCEDLKPGCPRFKFKGKPVQSLVEGLDDAVVATGLLEWAREGLHGGPDQRTLLVTTPKHLAFVEGVAEKHASLRVKALDILHAGFSRKYSVNLDVLDAEKLRDMFLQSMVSMIPLFMGPAVVEMFMKHYVPDVGVDNAHLRRFVEGLLQLIAPPYQRTFAAAVLRLVNHPRVIEAVAKEMKVENLVISFRSEVSSMNIDHMASVDPNPLQA